MYQDTRKQLKTVDISCYSKELATFQEKLKFRELAASTISNYLSNLKIILAWVVMFLSSKPADRISYDDFRMFLEFLTSGDLLCYFSHMKAMLVRMAIGPKKKSSPMLVGCFHALFR